MPKLKMLENALKPKETATRQLSMLESTFHEDWDEIGSNRAKKGHLLLKSTIFSKLAGCQWVKERRK